MEAKQMHSDFVTRTSVGFQSRSVLHVGLNKVSMKLQPSGWCICAALECDGKQQDLSDFQQQHAAITRRYFACLLINHSALKFQWPHECSHICENEWLSGSIYIIYSINNIRRESERRACVYKWCDQKEYIYIYFLFTICAQRWQSAREIKYICVLKGINLTLTSPCIPTLLTLHYYYHWRCRCFIMRHIIPQVSRLSSKGSMCALHMCPNGCIRFQALSKTSVTQATP
jgi:hypothetical protein